MAGVGRNQPCRCGSGRKTKRCCGVPTGPSEADLAKAALAATAKPMALVLIDHEEWELAELCDEMLSLPASDLSLLVPLPRLHDAALERLCRVVAEDDLDKIGAALSVVLAQLDTAATRARLASALLALVQRGRIATEVGAAAVIDLASGSQAFLRASLIQAVAVSVGAARTPSGLLVATR